MKKILCAVLLISATASFANKTCYELSSDGTIWPKKASLLCVEKTGTDDSLIHAISFETGGQVIASFSHELTYRVGSIKENKDLFELASTDNKILNGVLSVKFTGKHDAEKATQSGKVRIGKAVYSYRLAANEETAVKGK